MTFLVKDVAPLYSTITQYSHCGNAQAEALEIQNAAWAQNIYAGKLKKPLKTYLTRSGIVKFFRGSLAPINHGECKIINKMVFAIHLNLYTSTFTLQRYEFLAEFLPQLMLNSLPTYCA